MGKKLKSGRCWALDGRLIKHMFGLWKMFQLQTLTMNWNLLALLILLYSFVHFLVIGHMNTFALLCNTNSSCQFLKAKWILLKPRNIYIFKRVETLLPVNDFDYFVGIIARAGVIFVTQ